MLANDRSERDIQIEPEELDRDEWLLNVAKARWNCETVS